MIRYIDSQGLLKKMYQYIDSAFGTPASGKLIFLEVGSYALYARVHLSKALSMTLHQLKDNAPKFFPKKGVEIVLCSQKIGQSLEIELAAQTLQAQGYYNLWIYKEGKEAWLQQTLPQSTQLVPADGLSIPSKQEPSIPVQQNKVA